MPTSTAAVASTTSPNASHPRHGWFNAGEGTVAVTAVTGCQPPTVPPTGPAPPPPTRSRPRRARASLHLGARVHAPPPPPLPQDLVGQPHRMHPPPGLYPHRGSGGQRQADHDPPDQVDRPRRRLDQPTHH